MADPGKGLYEHLYHRFFEKRTSQTGYDFQHSPVANVPPPKKTFRETLAWWTVRGDRRKQIMAERDRVQREIIGMKARLPREAGSAMTPRGAPEDREPNGAGT